MALITLSKYARQFSQAFVFATIAFAHASLFVLVPYSGRQSTSMASTATALAMLVRFAYMAFTTNSVRQICFWISDKLVDGVGDVRVTILIYAPRIN